MKHTAISDRYAKALYASAKQTNTLDKTLGEVAAVAKLITSEEGAAFFANPTVSAETKKAVATKALTGSVSEQTLSFVQLLAENNRIELLAEIEASLQNLQDAESGVVRGVCKTAVGFDQAAKTALEEKLNKVLGKKVVINYQQDPSLLGGAVASVGGITFDDSLKSHLNKLTEFLNKGVN